MVEILLRVPARSDLLPLEVPTVPRIGETVRIYHVGLYRVENVIWTNGQKPELLLSYLGAA